VTVDLAGNVFIADSGDNRIRKVSLNGIITTVAGGGSSLGDGGLATSASLQGPDGGVVVDAAGNLYVFGSEGSRIRLIKPDGKISTIAGNGTHGFSGDGAASTNAEINGGLGPAALALSGSGNIYIADSTNQRVRLLSPSAAPAPSPTIKSGGIVPINSTATTVQSGSWVSIFGNNLAGAATTWNGDFPISLGGTNVTIDNKPAYLWYVSATQINLQVPDDNATGSVNVVVTTTGGTATSTVTIGQVGPSFNLLDGKHVAGIILRSDGSGAYGGGAYDIVGPTGTSLGFKTVAAKAGDVLELFGVGFGPTNPVVHAGVPFSGAAAITGLVQLSIGNILVTPAFTGITAAGLYQINILAVPSGLGSGDVPLLATVGGAQTPAGIVLSLQ
jgi:uncharacterized protein (TIGR03437 family)